jgi:tRNA(Ile)-lysidine synthase
LTGHHADDQAETVLMRRAKKSGVAGLAGIPARVYRPFGEILRPLLALDHDDLCAFDRQKNVPWEEDETNTDGTNARGRLRLTMSPQAREEALKTAETARIKRILDEERLARLAGTAVFIDAGGGVVIEKSAFTEEFTDCFAAVLRFVGQTDYAPNKQKTAGLMAKIVSNGFKGACLNGCSVFPAAKGTVYVFPEKNALPPPVALTDASSGRFGMWTWVFNTPQTGVLDALKNRKNLFDGRKDIPKRAQSGLPCFFNKQGLFLAPHLEYKKEETGARVFPSPKNAVCPHAMRV